MWTGHTGWVLMNGTVNLFQIKSTPWKDTAYDCIRYI